MAVRNGKRIVYFYGKTGVYVVIYRSKDKKTTQVKFERGQRIDEYYFFNWEWI